MRILDCGNLIFGGYGYETLKISNTMAPHNNKKSNKNDDNLRKVKKSKTTGKHSNRMDNKASSMGRRLQAVETILGGVLREADMVLEKHG